ncbi:MAG: hypothetical protein AB7V04_10210 [Desulfomonilaceae bacterium]
MFEDKAVKNAQELARMRTRYRVPTNQRVIYAQLPKAQRSLKSIFCNHPIRRTQKLEFVSITPNDVGYPEDELEQTNWVREASNLNVDSNWNFFITQFIEKADQIRSMRGNPLGWVAGVPISLWSYDNRVEPLEIAQVFIGFDDISSREFTKCINATTRLLVWKNVRSNFISFANRALKNSDRLAATHDYGTFVSQLLKQFSSVSKSITDVLERNPEVAGLLPGELINFNFPIRLLVPLMKLYNYNIVKLKPYIITAPTVSTLHVQGLTVAGLNMWIKEVAILLAKERLREEGIYAQDRYFNYHIEKNGIRDLNKDEIIFPNSYFKNSDEGVFFFTLICSIIKESFQHTIKYNLSNNKKYELYESVLININTDNSEITVSNPCDIQDTHRVDWTALRHGAQTDEILQFKKLLKYWTIVEPSITDHYWIRTIRRLLP